MNNGKGIPFLDLVTPHRELKEELVRVVERALDTAGFIGGPMVEGFERAFAEYCQTSYCIGVSSGTDAVRFALMASGVSQGDAVVTVPNTFIATGEAISQAGATPVFVDVDDQTYNMSPDRLKEYFKDDCYFDEDRGCLMDRRLGKRVAAVVPVHLYGQPADMDSILDLAEAHNITVVEDACQAHGAEYYSERFDCWKKAGSMGRAAAFSFYPGKNLGACGEGGAVTTNDESVARRIRILRDHGQAKKYYHDVEGYNGRLDAIQAGILRTKLGHLNDWNYNRRECAQRYHELLASEQDNIGLPYEPSWAKSVYHLYVVRVRQRGALQGYLAEHHIGTGIHYPVPLHLQKAYQGLGYQQGDFPVAEAVAGEILSLPMFPGLKAEDQEEVAQRLQEFCGVRQPATLALAAGAD
jgi:dTDP-4-amino-4,6-dideoxygalactose transaminase